jgi:DNA-binding winged helix-turn-helix (wHTH) protein
MVVKSVKSDPCRFGSFEFDPQTGELRKRGLRIRLEGQPVAILATLLERHGELVTCEELQKKLWPGDTFVDFEQSLNAAIRRLRLALDDSAESPRYIETLARKGYRWMAPVLSTPAAVKASAESAQSKVKRRWVRKAVWIGMVVAAASAAVFFASRLLQSPLNTERVMLAVLPFHNLSESAQQEYFADAYPDPVTGRRRSGTVTETETGVGVGAPPPRPCRGYECDPTATVPPLSQPSQVPNANAVSQDLWEKSLPDGQTVHAVAGYLYFPKPARKAKGVAWELRYENTDGRIQLPLSR